MHERSLMVALLKQVSRIQADHDSAVVEEIAIEVGVLSGVEAILLQSAFGEFAEMYPGARLLANEVPVTAICQDCGQRMSMVRFVSLCPKCQSPKLQITGGDTFRLLHVTLKDHSQDNRPYED